MSKGQDNFLPISKFVEKSKIKDPHNLELTLYINDKVRQNDPTSNMHFKIGETLKFITKYTTLNRGDLLLTGTPHGIGPIAVGDKLEANIKQDGNIIVKMNYDVIQDEDDKTSQGLGVPKF